MTMGFKRFKATLCTSPLWAHMGLARVECPAHGSRAVGVWAHVGSTMYLFGPRELLEAIG